MVYARQLGSIFSTDPELLDLYQEVGGPLAAMMVTFGMACFLERVPMAMGQAKVVMYLGLIGSWLGQVPGVNTAIDAFALLYNHTGASGACLFRNQHGVLDVQNLQIHAVRAKILTCFQRLS